jgi:hypothetical protein
MAPKKRMTEDFMFRELDVHSGALEDSLKLVGLDVGKIK